jgi:tetratricopeptide (TPR) repeat protein
MTSDAAANHVQVPINCAVNLEGDVQHVNVSTTSDNKEKFEEARELAEATIRFLNARSPRVRDETADDEDARKAIRKAKAKMSFRTHLTCKGLGDTNAAIGYLEEARKHEPETAVILNEKINTLRAQERNADDEERPAIRWEGRV